MTFAAFDDPGSILPLVVAAALLAWWTCRIRKAVRTGALPLSHEDEPDEEIDRRHQPDRFRRQLAIEIVSLVLITALLIAVSIWGSRWSDAGAP